MQWKTRFKLIKENIPLQLRMQRMDFICLQECTNPASFLKLLNPSDNRYQALSYSVDPVVQDHCVILYDAQKYILDFQIDYALEGKKPAIFARFYPKGRPEQAFVIGSIHHPGGPHNRMSDLFEQVNRLHTHPDAPLDYFMLGDYNHPAAFFHDLPEGMNTIFTQTGTMAGSDYGNTNQAIDGLSTNLAESAVHIEQINLLPMACPASADIAIEFVRIAETVVSSESSPRFFRQVVQSSVDPLVGQAASQLLGSSQPKLTAPVYLPVIKGGS